MQRVGWWRAGKRKNVTVLVVSFIALIGLSNYLVYLLVFLHIVHLAHWKCRGSVSFIAISPASGTLPETYNVQNRLLSD